MVIARQCQISALKVNRWSRLWGCEVLSEGWRMIIQQERDRPRARRKERESERDKHGGGRWEGLGWDAGRSQAVHRDQNCEYVRLRAQRQLPSSGNLLLLHHVEKSCCRETNRCGVTALMQYAVMASISYPACHQEALALWSHMQKSFQQHSLIQWNSKM